MLNKDFSRLSIFGIQLYEFKKFLPLAFIKTFIVFIYSILRASKDTIIVSDINAEVISSIKLWAVSPIVVMFVIIYSKLSNKFSQENLFQYINWFFMGFFALFGFVLYPNAHIFHFDVTDLISHYPHFKYPLLMLSNWTSVLFYVMAELWGTIMISLMFWQLANQINSLDEAKKTYAFFGMIGQIGLVMSGYIMGQINGFTQGTDWINSLKYIIISILISGFFISMGQWFVVSKVIPDVRLDKTGIVNKTKKQKMKLSVKDSLKYIFKSKYIGLIAVLVLCYGISISLVEGVWKSELKIAYQSKSTFSDFMGNFQFYSGFATMFLYLVGAVMLRKLSWKTCAMITPVIMLVSGSIFFSFIYFQEELEPWCTTLGYTTLTLAVISGALQNTFSKGTKYSLFDSTKEMAYIPLDSELKTKGKAAVDVTGGRLGKSGGASVQWLLLTIFPAATLVDLTSMIFLIFVIAMVAWLYAANLLGKKFNKITKKNIA